MDMAMGVMTARLPAPLALHRRSQRPQRALLYPLCSLMLLVLASCIVTADTAQYVDIKASAEHNPVPMLLPEHPRRGERLACGATRVYRVLNLRLDAVYDVKLSYPATIPTEFDLEVRRVLAIRQSPGPTAVDGPRRRVLNTAKLRLHPREILLRGAENIHEDALKEFPLDPSVLIDGVDARGATLSLELAVRGRVEGVSRVLDLENRECVFDIVVEELVLSGQIPRASLALIAWLVVALALAARFVFPFLMAKIALERPEDQDGDEQNDHKQS